MNNKRLSNFELLRIFAMIMTSHIFQHGVNIQIFDEQYSPAGEYFSNFMFYKKLVITYYAKCFGMIGNIIFILISGYFLIDKPHINIVKQIKKLLSQQLFVTIVLVLLSMVFLKLAIIKTNVVLLDAFNNSWWFIGLYVFIIIFAELFINNKINLNKEVHLLWMFICFSLLTISHTRGVLENIGSGLSNLLAGVFLYLLGGYIKLYNPFKRLRGYLLFLILFFAFLIMAISYYNFTMSKINQALIDGNDSFLQLQYDYYGMYAFPCIVIGVTVFEIFHRIKVKTIKSINFVAAATFIMYMSHENNIMWELILKIKWNELLFTGDYIHFCLYLFLLYLLFIFIGVALYSIYLLLNKLVNNNSFKILYLKN